MGNVRKIIAIIILFFPAITSFSQNDTKPVITGQTPSPLVTQENTPITITLDNLIVTDPDPTPVFPDGFTLELNSGDDYEFSGATVTPNNGFSGTLTVRVRVDDGENNSDWFDLKINVLAAPNVAPQITGQSPITIDQGESTAITLGQLTVTDPDNNYPTGFSLTIHSGSNYTFNGTTITPSASFLGALTVHVSVNDGEDESNVFDLIVNVVEPPNEPPQITGQVPISIDQGESVTLTLAQLTVTDPDDTYPTGFTLTVYGGSNYTVSGTTVTPAASFFGNLTVEVSVSDGEASSPRFDLTVQVAQQQNVVPQITGQSNLTIDQGESLTITLAQLTVVDPDNSYPADFTLTVYSGSNYTFTGTTITPSATFSGPLTVPVSVNDGENESAKFNLKVDVKKNEAPKITGQVPLSINQGESITLALSNLVVSDPDNSYPADFTLTVHPGTNYTVSGATITPGANFSGELKVGVSVNDGTNESNKFDLKINVAKVQNEAPKITGQVPLSVNQGESITLALNNLVVSDADNTYPTGFTLTVYTGTNYSVSGTTVTPAANFFGELKVDVSVNDGTNESTKFALKIEVKKTANEEPKITGQVPLSINQGQSLTIALSHLVVSDPDNSYPTGFTLTVHPGTNYTVSGATITPGANFSGELKVGVSVNDGTNESKKFDLKINVIKVQNEEPKITGQVPLSINQGQSLTIALSHLVVSDPDNTYPGDFTLTVYAGNNYTFSGTTITPAATFSGELKVEVSVSDGTNESKKFALKIEVKKAENQAPVITGQVPLSVAQGKPLTISLTHLLVSDPDNIYPTGFTLTVYSGTQYTLAANTITPDANFSGNLKVPVSVNDGQNESKKFDLQISVLEIEPSAPQITAQKVLTTNEDVPLTIALTDLTVVDTDNIFPQGFTLKLSPGQNYSVSGSTIVPAKNYFGQLSVPVTVNDGDNDSAPFQLQVTVAPVNDVPLITGQKKLETDPGVPITVKVTDLNVSDPDNTFPGNFTLNLISGANYSVTGKTITPASAFSGILNVSVTVSDGTASSTVYNLRVDVNSPTNVAPAIIGQKAISITQNTSITLQLFHLVVKDPDNEFPADFTLKVLPGTNYTVNGATVKPAASFATGTLSVGVKVNDGTNDSPLFEVKIQVTPISATPKIIGQRELAMMEDSTFTITLSDLIVTDSDSPGYPNGFTLKVLGDSQGAYKANGATVTPAADLNGFIEVGVTVSDGLNTSEQFRLSILVNPVNDPPKITLLESSAIPFEPGKDPLNIFDRLVLSDVDNDHLSMAEIGFRATNFNPRNDEILYDFDTTKIRVVRDPGGTLFLIGHATVDEYQTALRSMKYNYRITQDFNGNPDEVPSGTRTIYANVNDGQSISLSSERTIEIEAKIALDIPSAFTPNGDNANDTWRLVVSNKDQLDQTIIRVYNKRGLLIYEADGFEREWDGTFNGERLPVDTYYYTIIVKLPYVRQTYNGVVTILY